MRDSLRTIAGFDRGKGIGSVVFADCRFSVLVVTRHQREDLSERDAFSEKVSDEIGIRQTSEVIYGQYDPNGEADTTWTACSLANASIVRD